MANILYMAISGDGFIAGPKDETPWSVEEWRAFKEFVESCDAILLGRRTFHIMQQNDEFLKGQRYLIATTDAELDTGSYEKIAINTRQDIPQEDRLGIIGGGDLNGRLAQMGLIDEIVLDVEEIALGSGTRLFGHHEPSLKWRLLSSRKIGPVTTQFHYQVTS